jgi:Spy/CpxP family protein refolding chaperone
LAEQLKTEMGKDKPNRYTVRNLVKKISNLRTDIQLKHMDNMLELREELTPEQLEKFKEMLKKRRHKVGTRKHRKK